MNEKEDNSVLWMPHKKPIIKWIFQKVYLSDRGDELDVQNLD
jgi:hypothetical protein